MKFDLEKATHRETYQLLIGLVAPRPIALVTSMNEDGRLNAAPFSAYNYLCTDPPIIGMGVMDRPTGGFARVRPCTPTGRESGLKTRVVWVRLPPGAQRSRSPIECVP